MSMHRVIAFVIASAIIATTSSVLARDASVRVDGCAGAEGAVAGALALELGASWQLVPEDAAALRIEVVIADCDAEVWSARVLDAEGTTLRGPAELAMAGFPSSSRARIAALWIAEWLATIEGREPPPVEIEPAPTPEPAPLAAPARAAEPAPVPAVIDATPEPPLRTRFVGLASFRQVPDTPATLGGIDLAFQIARDGTLGVGAEIGVGLEGGTQWMYEMLVVRGTLSAFVLFGGNDWLEVDVGARATLEELVQYTRGAWRERLSGTLHGYVGGFVRTLVFVVPATVALAVDLEFGGAPTPVSYFVPQEPGHEFPGDYDDLLGGFYFSARAGVVIQ
ncbi:hypothetical protein DB32_008076 [Sandaracinus amylolyticus]|uniref:Uncharacterized protein n=2 Tax=Sandaracinus amylolyticus TaxID=927083 RepID=A0A0F6W9P3_9BACT|nr:hypothetical protein DB32_008076 [Sandaracinus amylolyticus]